MVDKETRRVQKRAADQLRVLVLDLRIGRDAVRTTASYSSRSPTEDWAERADRDGVANFAQRLVLGEADAKQKASVVEWVRFESVLGDPNALDVICRDEDDSLVRFRLRLRDRQPAVVGVEIRTAAGADLTSEFIRGIGMGWVLELLRPALASHYVEQAFGSIWRQQVQRPGRAGRPDDFYVEKALRYLEAQAKAPGRPVKWLVEQAAAQGRFETDGSWRGYLNVARNRELLTEAPEGKAGGELTPTGRAIAVANGWLREPKRAAAKRLSKKGKR